MNRHYIFGALVALLIPSLTFAQVIFPNRGGTGTSTAPTTGQVLVGQSDGTYGPQSTSSLNIAGSGGGGGGDLNQTDIDTEAELEAILTDVTNMLTNNDDTGDLPEGSNLYYTVARVQSALQAGYDAIFGSATTTDATSTNLAVTGSFNFLGTVITNVSTWFSGLFDSNLATKDTGDLSEGLNLYYTNERAEDAAGGMFTGNTETRITATYQDVDGTVDLVVDNDLGNYDATNLSLTESQVSDLTHYTDVDVSDYLYSSTTLNDLCVAITGGAGLCDGTDDTGGGGFDSTAIDNTTWSDGANVSNIWTFDVSGTDTTATWGSDLLTFSGSLTLGTGKNFTIGSTAWNSGDSIDGEVIANDTIDDDSIDFTDVTLADLTFDVGSVDTTEFGYLNGVTSAIQTQLDTKLADITGESLESLSDVGTFIQSSGDVLYWDGDSWENTATSTWDSNAETKCAGSTTYLDGEGNCDDISSVYQAADADLTTYAGITPSANVQSLLGAANYAAMRTLLDLEAGTDFYSIAAADAAFEGELDNSAGLRAALSDEVGTGAAYFVGGALGTPASVTLTNGTGLPISTGVSGLGVSVATFLSTPSSANLRAALTDEVGTGAAYFVGGALGTPASGNGSNLTSLNATQLTSGTIPAARVGSSHIDSATEVANDVLTHAQILDSDQASTMCIWFEDPTADDDFNSIWANKTANNFLLTEIWAESDQTVNFDLQVDDGTPADVNGTDISPAAGEAEDTTLSGDTTVAAGEELDLAITSVSGTPTWISICWTGNWVD